MLVTPKHHRLQEAFAEHLKRQRATAIKPNIERVDIRFAMAGRGQVLAEVKPTEPTTVRFAIRSAIGQLLDYRQKCGEEVTLLIVISNKPDDEDDLALALENGFGLAWRTNKGFEIQWPGSGVV
ncbi:MAG TPA: hypothetical protein VF620_03245 [Allosphingosinicella sp.]